MIKFWKIYDQSLEWFGREKESPVSRIFIQFLGEFCEHAADLGEPVFWLFEPLTMNPFSIHAHQLDSNETAEEIKQQHENTE